MAGKSFSIDIAAIRDRARQNMDQGHVISASGINRARVSGEFTDHADDIADLLGT